jgi:hypothetical protein
MLSAPHDLSPCLRPGDEVTYLGGRPWEDRTGHSRWAEFYLVLHRAGGVWTHLYRVAPGLRLELVLVRAVEGDARTELREDFFAPGP